MNEGKVLKHFLDLFHKIENSMEGSRKNQRMCIKQLNQIIQGESLHPKQIDQLPFPTAFFNRNGMLIKANKVLAQAANINEADLVMGHINFLNRIITENESVLYAAERVFKGEISIARDLIDPVSMFASGDYLPDCRDDYQTALFFPVSSGTEHITCGAIVLMRQRFD